MKSLGNLCAGSLSRALHALAFADITGNGTGRPPGLKQNADVRTEACTSAFNIARYAASLLDCTLLDDGREIPTLA